jgi:hypothetical protein
MWLRMKRLYSVYAIFGFVTSSTISTINAVPRQSFVIHPNGGWWQLPIIINMEFKWSNHSIPLIFKAAKVSATRE